MFAQKEEKSKGGAERWSGEAGGGTEPATQRNGSARRQDDGLVGWDTDMGCFRSDGVGYSMRVEECLYLCKRKG